MDAGDDAPSGAPVEDGSRAGDPGPASAAVEGNGHDMVPREAMEEAGTEGETAEEGTSPPDASAVAPSAPDDERPAEQVAAEDVSASREDEVGVVSGQDAEATPAEEQESPVHVSTLSPADREAPALADVAARTEDATRAQQEAAAPSDEAPAAPSAASTFHADAEPTQAPGRLPFKTVEILHLLGMNAHARNNIHLLEDHILLTAAGNFVILLNTETGEQRFLRGRDGGGIGALAVHPERRFFAVGEACRTGPPHVYVYEYPSLRLVQALPNGTERAYSALCFGPDGTVLAGVGRDPDYMLTLWQWPQARVMLRSKAFSQEVYSVSFSKRLAGTLYTSGTGHIRFWRMAQTFTGLKLQGDIGKFGGVEISDVQGYLELPNFKVLAGAESGDLHLWDGGLIEAVVRRRGGRPCHDGPVDVVMEMPPAEPGGRPMILTGGHDGFIRLWDLLGLVDMQVADGEQSLEIEPVEELEVGRGAGIRGMVAGGVPGTWVALDVTGRVLSLRREEPGALAVRTVVDFHAGGIAGLVPLPRTHLCVSAGSDGALRVVDYRSLSTAYSQVFQAPVTCVTPFPRVHDPTGRLVLAGFGDGSLRCAARCNGVWKLTHASRPHSRELTALACTHDGTALATGSSNGTVFFFVVSSSQMGLITPLACTSAGAPVTALSWSPDCRSLLVGCADGAICELLAPLRSVDTSESYVVSLSRRDYVFLTPEERGPRPGTQDEDGIDGPSAPTPAPAPAQAADAPKPRHPVTALRYATPRSFVVRVSGPASGCLWKCSLEDPYDTEGMPLAPASASVPTETTSEATDPALKVQAFGTADGRVFLQPRPQGTPSYALPPVPEAGGPELWEGDVHSMVSGAVSALALSFDGKYVISGARDGSMLVMESFLPGADGDALDGDVEHLPAVGDNPCVAAEDFPAGALTEEEKKRQAQRDAEAAAAESKKRSIRDEVASIRQQLAAIQRDNDAASKAERIDAHLLEVDPGLNEMMSLRRRALVEEAEREGQWGSEKKRLALEKVRQRFFGSLACDGLELRGLRSHLRVRSMRCERLSPETVAELAELRAQLAEESGWQSSQHMAAKIQKGRARGKSQIHEDEGMVGTEDHGKRSKQNKHDVWRQARLARQRELAFFMSTRPDEKYENPDDVAEIVEAERTMGDYKLKMDKNYIAPEGERVDAKHKRLQILVLEEEIFKSKQDFNAAFLALRDEKESILRTVAEKRARAEDIASKLGQGLPSSLLLRASQMGPEEVRDRTWDVVTEEDIRAHQESAAAAEAQGKAAGGFGGFSPAAAPAAGAAATAPATPAQAPARAASRMGSVTNESSAGNESRTTPARAAQAREMSVAGRSKTPSSRNPSHLGFRSADGTSVDLDATNRSQALEIESEVQRVLLEYELEEIQRDVDALVKSFDDRLRELRSRWCKTMSLVQYQAMRQLVMWQELQMLQEFEKKERSLQQKLRDKEDEAAQCEAKIADFEAKLESKQEEVEASQQNKQAVMQEFNELVPESHPFRDPLLKIFQRRIKRSRKIMGDEDDEDESGSDDDSDMDDGDFEDSDAEDEEACPPDCDKLVYEKVCELRERRLDEEDVLVELQKSIEAFKKEQDQAGKKLAGMEKILKSIKADILEFQKEKQQALNKVKTSCMLNLSQLHYLHDDKLPMDMSKALVFSEDRLKGLRQRIGELVREQHQLRVRQKKLRADHKQLSRSKVEAEGALAELSARATEIQLLKFGQLVDLEVVDRALQRKGDEDVREEVRKQERQLRSEAALLDKQLEAKQEELAELTLRNTQLLEDLAQLIQEQQSLGRAMQHAERGLFTDPIKKRREEIQERDEMVEVVQRQAETIESLRHELALLRSKMGSVYT